MPVIIKGIRLSDMGNIGRLKDQVFLYRYGALNAQLVFSLCFSCFLYKLFRVMVQLIGACAINYSAEVFRAMDMMTMTRIIWQIRFNLAILSL